MLHLTKKLRLDANVVAEPAVIRIVYLPVKRFSLSSKTLYASACSPRTVTTISRV